MVGGAAHRCVRDRHRLRGRHRHGPQGPDARLRRLLYSRLRGGRAGGAAGGRVHRDHSAAADSFLRGPRRLLDVPRAQARQPQGPPDQLRLSAHRALPADAGHRRRRAVDRPGALVFREDGPGGRSRLHGRRRTVSGIPLVRQRHWRETEFVPRHGSSGRRCGGSTGRRLQTNPVRRPVRQSRRAGRPGDGARRPIRRAFQPKPLPEWAPAGGGRPPRRRGRAAAAQTPAAIPTTGRRPGAAGSMATSRPARPSASSGTSPTSPGVVGPPPAATATRHTTRFPGCATAGKPRQTNRGTRAPSGAASRRNPGSTRASGETGFPGAARTPGSPGPSSPAAPRRSRSRRAAPARRAPAPRARTRRR